MVQLMAKFTLMCAIHVCVFQFYSSDLSELTYYTQVIFLMLHLSQSRVLHMSQTLCVLHASKILHVKSGVLQGNNTWRVQSYSTLLYCMVVLVYQIPVSSVHYSTGLFSLTLDVLHHGLNTCTAMCTMKCYQKLLYLYQRHLSTQLQIVVFCQLPLFQSSVEVIVSLLLSNKMRMIADHKLKFFTAQSPHVL